MASVLDLKNRFTESRDHEELLHDRVHVADTTDVFEADKASLRALLLMHSYLPVSLARGSPEGLTDVSL